MQEYIPLFVIALVATLFATIQDLRFREVANWLSFSFIASAFAYRIIYAFQESSIEFFLYGLAGFAIFFSLGYLFYYGKVFAGGDAKLLMGFGIILPYSTPIHLAIFPLALIFTLFLCGSIYSLCFSAIIVLQNKEKFVAEFKNRSRNIRFVLITSIVISIASFIAGFYSSYFFILAIFAAAPALFTYTKSLDKCMTILTPPNKLTEGDWLEKEIKIGKTIIKKSVHGLSFEDIKILKKANKSVFIKQGIPFVPAFLITLIIMGFFFLVSKHSFLPFSFLF